MQARASGNNENIIPEANLETSAMPAPLLELPWLILVPDFKVSNRMFGWFAHLKFSGQITPLAPAIS